MTEPLKLSPKDIVRRCKFVAKTPLDFAIKMPGAHGAIVEDCDCAGFLGAIQVFDGTREATIRRITIVNWRTYGIATYETISLTIEDVSLAFPQPGELANGKPAPGQAFIAYAPNSGLTLRRVEAH